MGAISEPSLSLRDAAHRLGVSVIWARRLRSCCDVGHRAGREYRLTESDLQVLERAREDRQERKRQATRRVQAEQVLRPAGRLNAPQAAELLGKTSRNYVLSVAHRLGIGERLGGGRTAAYSFDMVDIEAIRTYIEDVNRPEAWARRTAPMIEARRGSITRNRLAVRSHGLVTVTELAAELRRHPRTILEHVDRRGLGATASGIGGQGQRARVLTQDEAEVVRAATEATAFRDPERRSAWYEATFGSTRMYGQLAAEIAARRGFRVGRPAVMVPELEERAREALTANPSLSNSALARILGVSRDTVRRWRTAEEGFSADSGGFAQFSL